MKPTLLVMAAGMGSRYGGIKQIDPVGLHGEAILDYSVFDAWKAGFGKVVFIIRRAIEEEFKAFFEGRFPGGVPVDYVYQELDLLPSGFSFPPGRTKPWGTAHAILCARSAITGPFAVINADDFYGRDAFRVMAAFLENPDNSADDFSMVGYLLRNTLSENGSVSRGICEIDDRGFLLSVEEHLKIEKTPEGIVNREGLGEKPLSGEEVVSMNMFGFTPRLFALLEREFTGFLKARVNDSTAECYIPKVVNTLITSGEARVKVLPCSSSWFGITYQADKPLVRSSIRELIRRGEYPEALR